MPASSPKRPHPFEIVKISHFGTEKVNDDVVGVDQHPVGGRQAPRSARCLPNRSLIRSASLFAIDATCRVERPEAITIWSAMFDLPASGMETTSTAWSSSSDWSTSGGGLRRRSSDGRSAAVSVGRSGKWSPGEVGSATLARTDPGRWFGDASWGRAREGGWRTSDRAAGEAEKSPVHSTPSTCFAWLEGRTNLRSQPIARAAWAARS